METTRLGGSDIAVSRFCLGTMTWGSQNTEAEAHAQIDCALDHGVNFLDTAELYPTTPVSAETTGKTERIIGSWIARTGRRDAVMLATKVAGRGARSVRPDGGPITPQAIRAAVEASLKRLRNEVIDLYQLHWPNRGSYHFRQTWTYRPSDQPRDGTRDLHALLETLADLKREGKIREIGMSNETAWGMARLLELARSHALPRVVSIQNEYSLLHRIFDLDLAELCHHEEVGLLAYSPLAAGLLTGKYEGGARPPGSRATINDTLTGRINARSVPATAAYVALARQHGLDPAQMALAFAASRPFMASVIVGATTLDQLRNTLASADLTLAPEVLDGINAIRHAHPMPM